MYNPAPPQDEAGNALEQQKPPHLEGENGQGFRGVLSKGSNPSKDSNRAESPCPLRERPTNQVLSDQKAHQ